MDCSAIASASVDDAWKLEMDEETVQHRGTSREEMVRNEGEEKEEEEGEEEEEEEEEVEEERIENHRSSLSWNDAIWERPDQRWQV